MNQEDRDDDIDLSEVCPHCGEYPGASADQGPAISICLECDKWIITNMDGDVPVWAKMRRTEIQNILNAGKTTNKKLGAKWNYE